jgi:methionyl-tRNA formyltransferase
MVNIPVGAIIIFVFKVMKIAILCNDRLGFPAIHQLIPYRIIVAVGTTNRVPETRIALKHLCDQGAIPLHLFSNKDLEETMTKWLDQYQPDVVLVKTFPFKIPKTVLSVPKYGFINFHYAPLPAFRGSNPLFWMIRNGIKDGGVTIHKMDESFDTGEILLQHPVMITPETNYGLAISQLAATGAALTGNLLQGLLNNSLQSIKQDSSQATWYGRPKVDDLTIKWSEMNASDIYYLVNACNPWNKGAVVRYKGWIFALTDVSVSNFPVPEGTAPGSILRINEQDGLIISCKSNQAIRVNVVYTEEGFFGGFRIRNFGLLLGNQLDH